jgi:hypothetical protein
VRELADPVDGEEHEEPALGQAQFATAAIRELLPIPDRSAYCVEQEPAAATIRQLTVNRRLHCYV